MMQDIRAIDAHSPVWANVEHTAIDMVVQFAHLDAPVLFTATPTDAELHGQALFERANTGELGEIAPYVPPPITEPQQLARRQALMEVASIAMTPLEDAEALGIISDTEREQLTAWRHHRVALYRLPQSEGWPVVVNWPEQPFSQS